MGNDLDYSNDEVRKDVKDWGRWIAHRLGLAGFRLDAVKHFSSDFLREWISQFDGSLIMIGEYWRDDLESLGRMIEKFEGRLKLFDVMLACNMSRISLSEDGDLRSILDSTLMKHYPGQAVVSDPNPMRVFLTFSALRIEPRHTIAV